MEKCPYNNHNWRQNIPANVVLVLILAAIALLYYLVFTQELRWGATATDVNGIKRSLSWEGPCR